MKCGIGTKLLSAVVLTTVRLHLRWFGLSRTVDFARRISSWRGADEQVSAAAASALAYSVESVAALFPGRARCLEQSLTLYVLLRWSRLPAKIRIGVQALPFVAHAWVEIGGQPINSDAEFLSTLQAFPDLPA